MHTLDTPRSVRADLTVELDVLFELGRAHGAAGRPRHLDGRAEDIYAVAYNAGYDTAPATHPALTLVPPLGGAK